MRAGHQAVHITQCPEPLNPPHTGVPNIILAVCVCASACVRVSARVRARVYLFNRHAVGPVVFILRSASVRPHRSALNQKAFWTSSTRFRGRVLPHTSTASPHTKCKDNSQNLLHARASRAFVRVFMRAHACVRAVHVYINLTRPTYTRRFRLCKIP